MSALCTRPVQNQRQGFEEVEPLYSRRSTSSDNFVVLSQVGFCLYVKHLMMLETSRPRKQQLALTPKVRAHTFSENQRQMLSYIRFGWCTLVITRSLSDPRACRFITRQANFVGTCATPKYHLARSLEPKL